MIDLSATPVTLMLLIINVMVSLYALFMDQSLLGRLAFKPFLIREQKEYHRFISAGFVHVGLGHLLFNMITLYFFGPPLELFLGTGKFLMLYFGSELVAHGFTYYANKDQPSYAAVGASGAVSGVVLSFCLFQPFTMLYLFFAVPIPAILFAIGYIFGSYYAARKAKDGKDQGFFGGIAHEAHLGGAIGGLVLTVLLEPRSLAIFWSSVQAFIGRIF